MKKLFNVEVRETYRKTVPVYAESADAAEEEAYLMEECGDIDWDRADNFEECVVLGTHCVGNTKSEVNEVKTWAIATVKTAATVDSEWIMDKVTPEMCCEWLVTMRDCGVDVPGLATGEDLWNEVRRMRGDSVEEEG